jgi:hypothetical protein
LRPSGRGTPSGFPHLRRLPLPIIEAPPGGRSTNPPGRNSTAFAKIKQPSSSTAQKRQSARRGQADRLRLDPGDVANSKAARLNAKKRAAPQESNARPQAARASPEMAMLATVTHTAPHQARTSRARSPTASAWTNSSWHPRTAKAVFQGSRPTTWCMTPAAVAYPPLYASGGPAGGQTVAFDPRGTACGLNPCSTRGAWDRSKGVKGRACGPLRGGPCPRFAAGRATRPSDP